jgi:hypothetical protein
VASPKQKTFFGIRVPPGRHTFASKSRRTNPKETAIELDITPGQVVFIRLEMMIAGMGIVKYTAHLRVVAEEDGRALVAELAPLDVSEIDDKARVTTEAPAPARAEQSHPTSDAATLSTLLPGEQGIYVLANGAIQKIPGEITTLKETVTWGPTAIVKKPRSGTRLRAPLEFVIRCSPDTTAAEYVLMHLFRRGDRREFRTLESGKSGWQGPERMMVPFQSRRIAPEVYHLSVLAVPKGEYGFLAPRLPLSASAAASFVTFTFGVD